MRKNRRWKMEEGRGKIKILLLFIAVMMAAAPSAMACGYTFDVSLVSVRWDRTRNATWSDPTPTLGFNNWHVWKYKITVKHGNVNHGLDNWVLDLPGCYLNSPSLFKEIEASAGSASGNWCRTSVYSSDGLTQPDSELNLKGLKWTFERGNQLDRIGEVDYFWFSAPTSWSIKEDWGIKADDKELFGRICVPEFKNCHPDPGIPEPASMTLLGIGLLGLLRRKVAR